MVNKDTKQYMEISVFLDEELIIDDDIGIVKCPVVNDMQGGFLAYSYYNNMFLDEFEKLGDKFYNYVISNEETIEFFKLFLYYYKSNTIIQFKDNVFYILYSKNKTSTVPIHEQDSKDIEINFISENNVHLLMEFVSIVFWRDNSVEQPKMSKAVEEHLKRANKLKAELKAQMKDKDGIGVLEIMSSLCARHPSINLTNVKELNYYQILEQFHRLQMIDSYDRNSNAWGAGTLSEDGIKELIDKHYTKKIEVK